MFERIRSVAKFHQHPFAWIFVIALVVRLIYLTAMIDQIGGEALLTLSPDVTNYLAAAADIVEGSGLNSNGVLIFGPGYPMFLALQGFLFGFTPLLLIFIQIILSATVSVLLARFALRLIDDLKTAIVAGLLHALSMTSITLATTLLSDTLFMALILGGLILYHRGLGSGRLPVYIGSGLLFTAAALTRGVGMPFVAVLIILAVVSFWTREKKPWSYWRHNLTGPFLVVIIVLVACGLWGYRNYQLHGLPQVSFAGSIGLAKLSSLTKARLTETEYLDCLNKFGEEVGAMRADDEPYFRPYAKHAKATFLDLLVHHPITLGHTLLVNINDNVHCESDIQLYQLPRWRDRLNSINRLLNKKGLTYRASLLSLVGLILVWCRKKQRTAIILGLIWLYFAVFSGLTLWQGSRIFHPGIIASSILIAVVLMEIGQAIHRRQSSGPAT